MNTTINPDAIPSHLAHPMDFQAALALLDSNPDISYTQDGERTAIVHSRGHHLTLKYHADQWDADGETFYLAGFHAFNEDGEQLTVKPYPIDGLNAYILSWAATLPTVPTEITLRREMLGLTREEFAGFLGITEGSLERWEQVGADGRSLADVLAELARMESYASMKVHDMVQAVVTTGEDLAIPADVKCTYSQHFCNSLYLRALQQLSRAGYEVNSHSNN